MNDWKNYLILGDPLTSEQQVEADKQHAKIAVDNENYLASHPELRLLLSQLIHAILEARPSEPVKFAAEFFNDARLPELPGPSMN